MKNTLLPTGLVGAKLQAETQTITSEWMMAFAAAVGADWPAFLDNRQSGGLNMHTIFPVCYEWPAWLALGRRILPEAVLSRGVHSAHELLIHRPVRVGESLLVQARLISVNPKPTGMRLVVELKALDDAGLCISETRSEWFCPAVTGEAECIPDAKQLERPARIPNDTQADWTESVELAAGFAHIYTACSRIHNPIHTDYTAAVAAGLSRPIVHGTAMLALAVSALLRRNATDQLEPVAQVRAVFRQPVAAPNALVVEGFLPVDGPGREQAFRVRSGENVVINGDVQLHQSRK